MSCTNCGSHSIDYDNSAGHYACTNCGAVTSDNNITSELAFAENSGGGTNVVGQFLGRDGRTVLGSALQREARDITLQTGKRKLQQTIAQLTHMTGIAPQSSLLEQSHRLFSQALQAGYARGRRSVPVLSGCIYIASVRAKEPYLLIDLAETNETNVFELADCATQLARNLGIQLAPNDPSIFVHRYAAKMGLGAQTHQVASDAIQILRLMERDWITIGRRSNGLCAAALLLSARAHGFQPDLDELATLVKINPGTILARLAEISNSNHSSFTLSDLRQQFGDNNNDNGNDSNSNVNNNNDDDPYSSMLLQYSSNTNTTTQSNALVVVDDNNNTNTTDSGNKQLLVAADPPSFQRSLLDRTRIFQWRSLLLENEFLAEILIQNTAFYKTNDYGDGDLRTLSEMSLSKLIRQINFQLRQIDRFVRSTIKERRLINDAFIAMENNFEHYCLEGDLESEIVEYYNQTAKPSILDTQYDSRPYTMNESDNDEDNEDEDSEDEYDMFTGMMKKSKKSSKKDKNSEKNNEKNNNSSRVHPPYENEHSLFIELRRDRYRHLLPTFEEKLDQNGDETVILDLNRQILNEFETRQKKQSKNDSIPDEKPTFVPTWKNYLVFRHYWAKAYAAALSKDDKGNKVSKLDNGDGDDDDDDKSSEKDRKSKKNTKSTKTMKKKSTRDQSAIKTRVSNTTTLGDKLLDDSELDDIDSEGDDDSDDDDDDDNDQKGRKKSRKKQKKQKKSNALVTSNNTNTTIVPSDDNDDKTKISGLIEDKKGRFGSILIENGTKNGINLTAELESPHYAYTDERERVHATLSHLYYLQQLQYNPNNDSSHPLVNIDINSIIDENVINAINDALQPKTRSLLAHLTKAKHSKAPNTLVTSEILHLQNNKNNNLPQIEQSLPALTHISDIDGDNTNTITKDDNNNTKLITSSTSKALVPISSDNTNTTMTVAAPALIFPKIPTLHTFGQNSFIYDYNQQRLQQSNEVEFHTLVEQAVSEIKLWNEEKKNTLDDVDDDEIDSLILTPEERAQREQYWDIVIGRTHGISRQPKDESSEHGEGRKRARSQRLAEEEQKKRIDFSFLDDDNDDINEESLFSETDNDINIAGISGIGGISAGLPLNSTQMGQIFAPNLLGGNNNTNNNGNISHNLLSSSLGHGGNLLSSSLGQGWLDNDNIDIFSESDNGGLSHATKRQRPNINPKNNNEKNNNKNNKNQNNQLNDSDLVSLSREAMTTDFDELDPFSDNAPTPMGR